MIDRLIKVTPKFFQIYTCFFHFLLIKLIKSNPKSKIMNEKDLLKISLILAVIGMSSMLFLESKLQLEISSIDSLSNSDIGKTAKLHGSIKNPISSPKVKSFDLVDDSGKINIVSFSQDSVIPKGNNQVEVIGKVSIYKNKLQVIADTIKII